MKLHKEISHIEIKYRTRYSCTLNNQSTKIMFTGLINTETDVIVVCECLRACACLQVCVSALAARRKRFQLLHCPVTAGSSHLVPWISGKWTSGRVSSQLDCQLVKHSVNKLLHQPISLLHSLFSFHSLSSHSSLQATMVP